MADELLEEDWDCRWICCDDWPCYEHCDDYITEKAFMKNVNEERALRKKEGGE